jgi:hypothetical protein
MDTRHAQNGWGTGYKKNWVKWVGLYLLIGGAIYLIVYLVAFNNGGGGGTGGY